MIDGSDPGTHDVPNVRSCLVVKSAGDRTLICLCRLSQTQMLGRFQNLSANLNFSLSLPPGFPDLLRTVVAPAAAQAQARAAAQIQLAASAGIQAMAQLTAAAQFQMAMNAGLGVNLCSPTAPNLLGQLAMSASNFVNALEALPLAALANLLPLAELANLMQAVQTNFGLNLLSPATMPQLQAALTANANLSAQVSASVMAQAVASAQLAAVASVQAAAQAAFGANISTAAGLALTASALSAMQAAMASMPPFENLIPFAPLVGATQLLGALAAIKRAMGVDMLAAGALAQLQAPLALLGQLTFALPTAPSVTAGASLAAQASLALGASASASVSAGASASAQINAMMTAGLGTMMAGFPAIPSIPVMLALLLQQIASLIGNQPGRKLSMRVVHSRSESLNEHRPGFRGHRPRACQERPVPVPPYNLAVNGMTTLIAIATTVKT